MARMGTAAGVLLTMLTDAFPGLNDGTWHVTSQRTPRYNCIAWAADDDQRWWWPDPLGLGYWPDDVPRDESIDAFVSMFESLGFQTSLSAEPEQDFEKIALYARDNCPTHAARQLENGSWTSKLGPLEDITHSLSGLAGETYGEVVSILKRSTPRVTDH